MAKPFIKLKPNSLVKFPAGLVSRQDRWLDISTKASCSFEPKIELRDSKSSNSPSINLSIDRITEGLIPTISPKVCDLNADNSKELSARLTKSEPPLAVIACV